MTRRVILVGMNWTRDKDPRIPLGHASILAALESSPGLEVRSVVVAVNAGDARPASLAASILAETSGLASAEVDVAFGAYVWNEPLLRDTLAALRRRGFAGRIVLGGPQISYAGSGLEAIYPEADAFVRGYGEEALVALASTSEPSVIPGVHWAHTRDLESHASVDLEHLASPWLSGLIPLVDQGFVRWETQRGCPFRCSFCQHREPGARLRRRELGMPRIEAEIDLFCEHGVADIAVLDPVFNMAPHATAVLERFAERGFKGRLSLQCRPEAIDDTFLEAASALRVRLEFGLQTIHRDEGRAVRRLNDVEKVDRVLAAVRRLGIDHEVSLIFGLPLQTLASFEASVRWCLERGVPVIKAFPLLLLRGTELERDRDRWGFVDAGGDMPMVVASSTFDRDDWWAMARIAEALRLTEGHHPTSFAALERLAAETEPSLPRWQPDSTQEAA